MEPKQSERGVDISACLEAVNQYDAAYHRERDNPGVYTKPMYVSVREHIWAQLEKVGTGLLGRGLFLAAGICVLLIVANVVRNVEAYQAAHVAVSTSSVEPIPYGNPVPIPDAEPAPRPLSTSPSGVPLPENWFEENFTIYSVLICLCVLSYWGGGVFLRQADKIKVGIPLLPADTAHLPAPDTLVRASSEPIQAQENVLLRSVAAGQETPPEQLVRAMNGQE